jgi:predicted RNA-binding protein with PUA-like domain
VKKRERHYWAFRANPQKYNIQEVLQNSGIEIEHWNNPHNSDVREEDRAIIWQKASKGQPGGIVALGDVLEDSTFLDDNNQEYWLDPHMADKKIKRVKFRYVRHKALPLWENRADLPLLKTLTVATGQMGSIFRVTSKEWDALMNIIGGWPESAPEVAAMKVASAEYAGKRYAGQGYMMNAQQRRAIEQYAMQKARAFYEEQGYTVTDVSATRSFDLICKFANRPELHVEVKGTTSDGTQILLTPNEVAHAQSYPYVALFLVSHIQVDPTDPTHHYGGTILCLDPWNIQEKLLTPVSFVYDLQKMST